MNNNISNELALFHLRKSLSIDPNHIPTISLICEIYLINKKFDMIEDLIVNSIKRGLKSSEFHYLLAKKNLYCSSFEEAKFQIDQAINAEKNILKYYKLAIKILQNYKAEHLASPYLEMIIKLDPNDGNAYYLLSKLITQKENYQKKISLLEVTNDLISDHYQAQFDLAVSHMDTLHESNDSQNDYIKIKNIFSRLLRIDQYRPKVLYKLGELKLIKNNFPEAIKLFEESTKHDETKGIASYKIANLKLLNEDFKSANLYFKKSFECEFKQAECSFNIALIHYQGEEPQRAFDEFKKAELLLNLEKKELEKESKKSANLNDFDRARQLYTDSLNIKKLISKTHLYIHKINPPSSLDDQQKNLMKIIDLDFDNFEAHYELGIVHLSFKEIDKAQKSFEYACELNWEHINSHLQLAHISLMKKKREKSKMHYQIVLDLEPNNKEAIRNTELLVN